MRNITESACFVSLSILLSRIILFRMPFGGSICLANNLPLILLSYKCGYKTGIFSAVVYSLIYIILSFKIPLAKDFISFILLIFLDYLLPNIVMGISSFFSEKIHSRNLKIYFGTTISYLLKIIISTISGIVLWGSYIPFECNLWIYSIVYNLLYILPDFIITFLLLRIVIKFTNI